jgi:LPS export ABC transporter protein LptC
LTALFACENDLQTINSLSASDTLPQDYYRNIEVVYSDSGKIKVFMESPLMKRVENEDEYFEFPNGFKVIFYDSIMNPKSTITAKYGISYEKKKIMEAKNNVVVINAQKNEQLDTEHLIWDRKRSIIYSEVFVKITRSDEVLYGTGLTSDQNFEKYNIKNPTGEFQIDPDTQ